MPMQVSSRAVSVDRCNPLRGWIKLGIGVAALWLLTFVLLPLGQKAPIVEPMMSIIVKADINAGSYWYTQSEETAYGAMYVRKTLDGVERRK
jgi:hypothetical protein